MRSTTRTITSNSIILDDGREFDTTPYEADECIDPKVEELPNGGTAITFAVRDDDPRNPREDYDHSSTMVVTNQPWRMGLAIDEADAEVNDAFRAAEDLADAATYSMEPYYVVRCGCWWLNQHDLEDVEAGDCLNPVECLYFGEDQDHYSNGETCAFDPMGYDLPFEAGAALISAYMDSSYPAWLPLMRAALAVTRPDITAIKDWGVHGYSQGDWADGYIYTTATTEEVGDPEALLDAELKEYESYFCGEVYGMVREEYDAEGNPVDDFSVWGFFGEGAVVDAIEEGL